MEIIVLDIDRNGPLFSLTNCRPDGGLSFHLEMGMTKWRLRWDRSITRCNSSDCFGWKIWVCKAGTPVLQPPCWADCPLLTEVPVWCSWCQSPWNDESWLGGGPTIPAWPVLEGPECATLAQEILPSLGEKSQVCSDHQVTSAQSRKSQELLDCNLHSFHLNPLLFQLLCWLLWHSVDIERQTGPTWGHSPCHKRTGPSWEKPPWRPWLAPAVTNTGRSPSAGSLVLGEHADLLVFDARHQIPLGQAPSDADQRREPPLPWPQPPVVGWVAPAPHLISPTWH